MSACFPLLKFANQISSSLSRFHGHQNSAHSMADSCARRGESASAPLKSAFCILLTANQISQSPEFCWATHWMRNLNFGGRFRALKSVTQIGDLPEFSCGWDSAFCILLEGAREQNSALPAYCDLLRTIHSESRPGKWHHEICILHSAGLNGGGAMAMALSRDKLAQMLRLSASFAPVATADRVAAFALAASSIPCRGRTSQRALCTAFNAVVTTVPVPALSALP